MRAFIDASPKRSAAQSLQIIYADSVYRLQMHHATLDNPARGPGRRRRQHAHAVYHAVLYVKGQGDCQVNGRPTPFTHGTLVLTSPEQPHDFRPLSSINARYHEVTFALVNEETEPLRLPFDKLLDLYSGVGIELQRFHSTLQLAEDQINEFGDLVTRLIDFLEARGPLSGFYASFTISRLLALLVRVFSVTIPAAVTPLDSVRQTIERHCHKALKVSELADQASLSTGYFQRVFKKRSGYSPIAYQHHVRSSMARVLLQTTELSLKEIAARLGYSDVYHFSKAFKKVTGRTPGSLSAPRVFASTSRTE